MAGVKGRVNPASGKGALIAQDVRALIAQAYRIALVDTGSPERARQCVEAYCRGLCQMYEENAQG